MTYDDVNYFFTTAKDFVERKFDEYKELKMRELTLLRERNELMKEDMGYVIDKTKTTKERQTRATRTKRRN